MPNIYIEHTEYDWFMAKRKMISIPGKPQKFESAASTMKRLREYCKEGFA
jgi:hypothetical protein